ncbi:DUF6895 family protein [Kitasatospora sp. NPDC088548]|uniref:DUF6895 family protein n=1 Tax=Kitasatospora sp. NPDC088548 TaxID=3364075 RepID=UPI003806729C
MSSDLDRLSAGALGWLVRNLDYFDPYSASARPLEHGKAKAALELALLCHCWARLGDEDDARLGKATAVVRTVWQHPDFPRLITGSPRYAAQYALVYAALAPDGIDDTQCRAGLARLTDDDLSPRGKSPYQRLEFRYYADKAGVRHTIEPYEELAGQNVLVTLAAAAPGTDRPDQADQSAPGDAPPDSTASDDAPPVTIAEAYGITHSAFYFSDFGRTGPALSDDAVAGATELVRRTLEYCVRHDWWDLVAELVMTQACLGADPLRTPLGVAAVECLARAQRPDGAIPGRSASTRATAAEPAGAFFEKAYHTTLVTALMSLAVSSARAS